MLCFENQTLFDIAIQACGDVQAAYDIALLNNLDITHVFAQCTDIAVSAVMNNQIVEFYIRYGFKPATGTNQYAFINDVISKEMVFDDTFDQTFE